MKKKIYRYVKDLILYNKKNISIVWLPIIDNVDDLNREVSRCAWYITPIMDKVDSIDFFVNKKFDVEEIIPPNYVDKNILDIYQRMKSKINFKYEMNTQMIEKYDIIVAWKASCKTRKNLKQYKLDVDVFQNQFEANHMMKLSRIFMDKEAIRLNDMALRKHLLLLKSSKAKHVFVVGSGPSNEYLHDIKFPSDAISIICNSVVKNLELLRKINPKIIVATDAVFHAGYSEYAYEFRQAVAKALNEFSDLYLYVPLRDLKLYKCYLPEFSERIIAINSLRDKEYNINLQEKVFVRSTSNVLTLFMLPIACSITGAIVLTGFDGKEISDTDTFWKYNKDSQFLQSVDSTKLAHPAFYSVNYDEYYVTHCQEVNELINLIKTKGIVPSKLGKSSIPALGVLENYD